MLRHTHDRIMVINTGSSSLRMSLFQCDGESLQEISSERFDTAGKDETALLREFMRAHRIDETVVIAHRVVHGGARFKSATIIDDKVRRHIADLAHLAPLHNPAALRLIEAMTALVPAAAQQIAVFDTAFFHELPAVARTYAIPAALSRAHAINRYGFHGLAHEYMWRQWCVLNGNVSGEGRLITLQLGSGCSIAAIRNGRALDTSMGFSPLEGLVMATRSGDIDPGILIYLQKMAGYSVSEVDDLLNQRSGLLGVSELSADMRELLASTHSQARLALDIYIYRVRKYIGSYLAVLGGADGIVFGGGVGENSAEIRRRVLDDMSWCGIELAPAANEATTGVDGCLSESQSRIPVWAIKVREELRIAQQACALMETFTHG